MRLLHSENVDIMKEGAFDFLTSNVVQYSTVRIFRPQLSLLMKTENRKSLFTPNIHHSRSVSGKIIAVNKWNPLALGVF